MCALQGGGQEGRQVGWAQLRWSRPQPCSERGRRGPQALHTLHTRSSHRWGRDDGEGQLTGFSTGGPRSPPSACPSEGPPGKVWHQRRQCSVTSAHRGCLSCRTTFSTPGFSYELQCETIILENETSSGRLWKSSGKS